MIKFTLIIWVCSFLAPDLCMKPIVYPTMYNSWYECSRAAHRESIEYYQSSDINMLIKIRLELVIPVSLMRPYRY